MPNNGGSVWLYSGGYSTVSSGTSSSQCHAERSWTARLVAGLVAVSPEPLRGAPDAGTDGSVMTPIRDKPDASRVAATDW
jgi:hypothetical protein